MGRASVRAAIAAWLTPVGVGACLGTTYAARPKSIPAQAFKKSATGGSGAVLVIHLTTDDEHRAALGGATSGGKWNVHDVALEVKFESEKVDPIAAQADHDALIDAIVTRLRADRTLGTGGTPIWQAGEDGEHATTGIKVDMAEPVLSKQALLIEAVIHIQAIEYLVT